MKLILLNILKKVLMVLMGVSLLTVVFLAGTVHDKLKRDTVKLPNVCSYCTGENWPELLQIQGDELRVTCGRDENERIGVIMR